MLKHKAKNEYLRINSIENGYVRYEKLDAEYVTNTFGSATIEIFDRNIRPQYEAEIMYTAPEVRNLIQMIYSEFAELESAMKTTWMLQEIIRREVEQHPLKPIQIFVK